MNVEQIMTSTPTTIHTFATMDEAAGRMWDCDCGALPVIDEADHLVGMITDRDICMAAYTQGKPLGQILVDQAATKQVFRVTPDTPVDEAERIMQREQIRRLPIVDSDDHVIGMLSLNDIARASGKGMRDGVSEREVVATLAAICQPRHPSRISEAASKRSRARV